VEEALSRHVDEEARRLVEEGWRPYWNKRRNLIVFKKGNETKSLGLTYDPNLYQELLRLYRATSKPEGYGEIEKAVREARTAAKPIEKERIDRLAEHEALVTELGRAALEIYSDVSVEPEELIGKPPDERARVKARAIVDRMRFEHRPPSRGEKEPSELTSQLIKLLPSFKEEEETWQLYYHIVYTRLFIEAVKCIDTRLLKEAVDTWNKLMDNEELTSKICKWAAEKSGLKALSELRKRELSIRHEARKTGMSPLALASKIRAEWESVKRSREQPIEYGEPLPG